MEVTLLTSEFAKTLNVASRFVSTRSTLPILSNIALKSEKSSVLVLSTDLEVSLAAKVGAKISEEGEIALPSKAFSETIANLGGEQVILKNEGEVVVIQSEGFKSQLNGINTSEYPRIVDKVSESALSIPTKLLVPALNKVLFAASTDEARPILTGVLFIFRKNELVLVATDGFRLSQKKFDLESTLDDTQIVVPKRILAELPRLVTTPEVSFESLKEDNLVAFAIPNIVLTSRVLEGEFPNYERIMPKLTRCNVNVSKEDLARAVKLSSIFARDNANTIKLTVKENELMISGESQKNGTEELNIPAKVEGEKVSVSFNFRFIEEFLGVVGGESVELKLNDATAPSVFSDPKDASFLHLIMPVRA